MDPLPSIAYVGPIFGRFPLSVATGVKRRIDQGLPYRLLNAGTLQLSISERFINGLRKDDRPAGLILHTPSRAMFDYLSRNPVPVVQTSNRDLPHAFPAVVSDDREVGRMAARHLLDLGFQVCAFVGLQGYGYSDERRIGFESELRERQSPAHPVHIPVLEIPLTPGSTDPLPTWLAGLPFPSAILASDDSLARRIQIVAGALGIQVPDQLAICGVNNDETDCTFCPVPLTSVETGAEEIGRQAMDLLHRLILGHAPPRDPILIPPVRLHDRRSTDALSVADPAVREALQRLRDHLDEPIEVDAIARAVGLPRRTLERKFQAALGRSPYAELLRLRIDRAARMLVESERPVGAIAEAVGFSQFSDFSQRFKKQMGMSPLRYRKTHQPPEPAET